jgi:hypothetical protein
VVRTRNLTVEKSGALGLVLQQAVNKMVPANAKILTLQDLKVKNFEKKYKKKISDHNQHTIT